MSKVVIECSNLTKRINKKKIIDDISFKLYEGDILGFIGANGSGKSTTIKSLLGLYRMDSGIVEVMGYNIKKDFDKAISYVGAIIENPDLYSYLTGYENLKICQKIYNISNERLKEVIRLVGLEDKINDKVCNYSLGMKQRLGIAQAIIHSPKLLILDEPMNGLDPEGIKDLKELLVRLSNNKMAIIVSSHLLRELESFCNKICIINQGKIVKYVSVDELDKNMLKSNYVLELSTVNIGEILDSFEKIDMKHIRIDSTVYGINNIIKKLLDNNIEIYEIRRMTLSLEDVYLSQIGIDVNG